MRHKWFVFMACLQWGVPIWSAILHDWDKFLPDEWLPYARTFYKEDGSGQYVESEAFNLAWLKHQNRNKHHWQYWLLTFDKPKPNFGIMSHGEVYDAYIADADGNMVALIWERSLEWLKEPPYELQMRLMADMKNTPIALPMPEIAMREMLADWYGAGRAYNTDWTPLEPLRWYNMNKNNMVLHPDTRAWVESELARQEANYIRYVRHHEMGIV